MPVVLTERLVLAPVTVADVDDLVTLHGDPDVAHWYGGPWTEVQARGWADDMSALWVEQGVGRWSGLDAERVVALTEVHNRASRAVMERLGMVLSGVILRPGLLEGRTGVHADAPFALYTYDRP
jgi:RimJ/RimL family protein N-acetyltransferase